MSIRHYAGQEMYCHECPQCGDSWWDTDQRDLKCLFCARWAAYADFMRGAQARQLAGKNWHAPEGARVEAHTVEEWLGSTGTMPVLAYERGQ